MTYGGRAAISKGDVPPSDMVDDDLLSRVCVVVVEAGEMTLLKELREEAENSAAPPPLTAVMILLVLLMRGRERRCGRRGNEDEEEEGPGKVDRRLKKFLLLFLDRSPPMYHYHCFCGDTLHSFVLEVKKNRNNTTNQRLRRKKAKSPPSPRATQLYFNQIILSYHKIE